MVDHTGPKTAFKPKLLLSNGSTHRQPEDMMFEVAEAYEQRMGRWSRQLAPLFVDFVGVRDGEKVLDAGCGTGSLSATLAKVTGASKIVGIDSSKGFIEYARMQVADPRVIFEVADAQDLRYSDHTFDVCAALLAVDHIPDAPKATKEMRRVTKTLGVVATAMWDRSHDNELYGCFWDAAEATDPTAKRPSDRRKSYGSPEALSQLWNSAGLTEIKFTAFSIACQFSSFDELWQRCLDGDSPPGVYMKRLSADGHEALRKKLRQNVLSNGSDGRFSLKAKAWAVRGVVP